MKNIYRFAAFLVLTVFVFSWTTLSNAQETSHEPVIIIPGIVGSWNWDVLSDIGLFSNNWKFSDDSYDALVQAFEDEGYVEGKDLFIVFYDWRESNLVSAHDYLLPIVNEAVVNSPTGKVNIVAHSMGGLVARAYIEGGDYENNVDQLILLGTPSEGSSEAYLVWEGAQLPSTWTGMQKTELAMYLNYKVRILAQEDNWYDAIHQLIPSVGELFPLYDFLRDKDAESYRDFCQCTSGPDGEVYPSDGYIFVDPMSVYDNQFLESLFDHRDKLKNVEGITTIAGTGYNTLETIPVVSNNDSDSNLWQDGMPDPLNPVDDSTDGDGTVMSYSALIPKDMIYPVPVSLVRSTGLKAWFIHALLPVAYAASNATGTADEVQIPIKAETILSSHGDLPTKAIPEVFTALGLTPPSKEYAVPDEPDDVAAFLLASPVSVEITDPDGRTITEASSSIPDAVYTGETDPNGVKMVLIPDPETGEYKVHLTGTEDGEYHMLVGNFNNGDTFNGSDTDDMKITEGSVTKGEHISYTVSLDPEHADTPPEISQPVILEPQIDETSSTTTVTSTSDTATSSEESQDTDVSSEHEEHHSHGISGQSVIPMPTSSEGSGAADSSSLPPISVSGPASVNSSATSSELAPIIAYIASTGSEAGPSQTIQKLQPNPYDDLNPSSTASQTQTSASETESAATASDNVAAAGASKDSINYWQLLAVFILIAGAAYISLRNRKRAAE